MSKILTQTGLSFESAHAIVEQLRTVDIYNLKSDEEYTQMLSETVQKVFEQEQARRREERELEKIRLREDKAEAERRLALLKEAQDKQLAAQEKRLDELRQSLREERDKLHQAWVEEHLEHRRHFRWLIGTIITVAIAIISSFSILIHLNH